MDTFMSALIKMSLRGVVIILIVLAVRFLMKKLQIGHKYILGLWAMAFLYFIFPWKLSLPVGFWNSTGIQEEIGTFSEFQTTGSERGGEADVEVNMIHSTGIADNTMADAPAMIEKEAMATGNAVLVEPVGTNQAGINEIEEKSPKKFEVWRVTGLVWLAGFTCFLGHLLYSYLAMKRKLRLSVLWKDNIWWAEEIEIPIVYGLLHSRIYLPVSMESENLPYVIAHEKMHVKRKDSLFKMAVYAVCLIHWFNPFVWIAYFLFGSDMEKACDEAVIQDMDKEKRKEYAYTLLRIAAGDGAGKKKIFVAPICFDAGNVKERIWNIMQYKYTIRGIGTAAVIVILALSVLFLTEAKDSSAGEKVGAENRKKENAKAESGKEENEKENINAEESEEKSAEENLPAFYVDDLSALQIEDNFSLEDFYITNRYTGSNHYYIDENGVLWGTGKNEFGQLGTGTHGIEEYYEEPVKIAENVLSVDASWNGYFCIYLTEGGELYGIGLNVMGLLLGKGSEIQVYSSNDFQKVTEPVLLMTDVAYARAGRECIVALQRNKAAYWWGQYAPLTHTNIDTGLNYWKAEEDASNPVKMLALEPVKIMENCRYISTGAFTGAAISDAGELYTWGFNVFGQCGTPVMEDDFVRTPVKVMDDVKMVWQGRIVFNDLSQPPEFGIWESSYEYNTFVLKEDGSLSASGLNLGDKEKVTQVNGDLTETQTHRYDDVFVPIQAVQYSADNNLTILSQLEFDMSMEEVKEILDNADMQTFQVVDESIYREGYAAGLSAQYNQYHCYFDSQDKLARITLQEGGSRDGRFQVEMSLLDLEKTVREAGGNLSNIESDSPWDTWVYLDEERQIRYEFSVYDGRVSVVSEIAIIDNAGQ